MGATDGGDRRRPKSKPISQWTAWDYAALGIGEPIDHDTNGVPQYAEYHPVPLAAQTQGAEPVVRPTIDGSLLAIVNHWRYVQADLMAIYGIDLWDPAILARPWPGVRTAIFALLDHPDSLLRRALTIREAQA